MNTMSTVKNVVCCYVFLFILSVFGSREDVRATLQICKKGLDVSDEELEAFIKPAVPKTDYEKCLWACTLKAYNIIKEGKYDPDMALDVARDMLKNEPEGLKKIENFINYTRQEVEEMDDECELASEIVHCYGKYEKFEEEFDEDYPQVSRPDTYESPGFRLSPSMIMAGGRLALRFLMNGIEQGVGRFIPGLKDIIDGWKNYGLGIIRPMTGDRPEPDDF